MNDKLRQLKERVLSKSGGSTVFSDSLGLAAGISSKNDIPNSRDVCTGIRAEVSMPGKGREAQNHPASNDLYLNANQTAKISDPGSLCRFVKARSSAVSKHKKKGKWI